MENCYIAQNINILGEFHPKSEAADDGAGLPALAAFGESTEKHAWE